MKKTIAIMLAMFMLVAAVFALAACTPKDDGGNQGGQGGEQGGNQGGNQGQTSAVDATISDANLKFSGTLYVTNIGQNADAPTLVTILESNLGMTAGTDFTYDADLTAAEVAEGSVVIAVCGASTKGMGNAGTDAAKELARAQGFAAKEGISLIVMQLGGSTRRGNDSDAIYGAICPAADLVMIVDSANNDGKFDTWCANVPLYKYSRATKTADSLKFVLGK